MFKSQNYVWKLNKSRSFAKETYLKLFLIQQSQRFQSNEAQLLENAKSVKEIPGPSKWQFVRGFLSGGKYHNVDFTTTMGILRKDYGDLVSLPAVLGRGASMLAFKVEDIETVFRNDDVWPAKDAFHIIAYHRLKHRKDYFQNVAGLLPSNDEQWGSFRKTVNPILMQPKTITNYIGRMSQVSDEFVQKIKDIRNPSTLEVPADFDKIINAWALESVTVVALDTHLNLLRDKQFSANAQEFLGHLKVFFQIFSSFEMEPPIWKIIATPKFKLMMQTLDGITDFVDSIMSEAKQRIQAQGGNEKSLTEQSVFEQLIKINPIIASVTAQDMLFGGVDTTTSAFAAVLLGLAKAPLKQQRLREEILKILPDRNSVLTEANMKNMPYLRACIKEALRLYPVGPGAFRTLTKDIVLSGYAVPKNTNVIIMNYAMLKDPKYFKRPNEFLPERWLRKEGAAFVSEQSHPFAYFPFGFGARSCVGKRLVNLELEVGITKLLRNFQLEFNYPAEDVFKPITIYMPVKPLTFKFTDY